MVDELLKKISPETCWAITAETLTRFNVLSTMKTSAPFLGKSDGILSLLSGWDMWVEIKEKVYGDGGRMMFPLIKETFNIPVEDAIGAMKLLCIASYLLQGPEYMSEIIEGTPERVVWRVTKCAWWERFNEHEIEPGLIPCNEGDQAWAEEGLKEINPKLTFKITKSMPWGDPYCECVIEFSDK
jgi:hypothetical protein